MPLDDTENRREVQKNHHPFLPVGLIFATLDEVPGSRNVVPSSVASARTEAGEADDERIDKIIDLEKFRIDRVGSPLHRTQRSLIIRVNKALPAPIVR